MVSVRKRKMARSLVPKNTVRTKDRQRAPKIAHHPIIAAKWDKKLTFKQNYEKLGLLALVNGPTGGKEAHVATLTEQRNQQKLKVDPESIAQETDPEKIPEGEARIIRNEAGEVERVVYGTMKPVSEEVAEDPPIIAELEQHFKETAKPTRDHVTLDRQDDFIAQLIDKHGDDYEAMKWDKLNNAFLTVSQLRKMAKGYLKKRS